MPSDPEPAAAPDAPPEPQVQNLIAEEKKHLRKAVRAAEHGPSAVAEEAVAHAETQVHRAVTIKHYERVLDAALRNLPIDDLLPEILGRIRSMLEADEATVFLLDQKGEYLYAKASVGLEEAVESGVRIPVGEGLAGSVVSSRQSRTLYEVTEATVANPMLVDMGVKSVVSVPILIEDAAIGVLSAGCVNGRRYEDHEVRLLEVVAERVGLAIERTRILQDVERERSRAEKASRFKTTLLRMASHDLKTPLTAMRLQSRLLALPETTPQRRQQAGTILERSIQRLDFMLDDFLDLARAEAGKLTVERAPIDLLAVAKEVATMFEVQAAQKGLTLHVSGSSVPMEGDARRLTQAVVNLVSNAIRYTPKGTIELAVEHAPSSAKLVVETAQLIVLDTGQGMTAEQIERLFRPFAQVHEGHQEGSGLGLHLAKLIVDAHGGTIRVESPGTGKGTSVIVELPTRGPPPNPPHPSDRATRTTKRGARAARGRKASPSTRPGNRRNP